MLEELKFDVISILSKVQVRAQEDVEAVEEQRRRQEAATHDYQHANAQQIGSEAKKSEPVVRTGQKVGRNEPCPCGSGKKYKHCHGKLR